jgi:deoxyadenosine/deoxycytidine kinase
MITDDGARKPDNSEGLKNKGILIGVVGVCASGKSTLVKGLEARGYRTRHIAQEHSYVKDMWKRITNPDLLIYLDVSYPTTIQRRNLNWTEADYAEEQRRLLHAREHADLYVNTDPLSIEEVLEQVIRFIMTFHR